MFQHVILHVLAQLHFSERAIISKLGTYVEQVNRIFNETHFEGYNYKVQFLLQRVHVR